jgi:hypothetical protein
MTRHDGITNMMFKMPTNTPYAIAQSPFHPESTSRQPLSKPEPKTRGRRQAQVIRRRSLKRSWKLPSMKSVPTCMVSLIYRILVVAS